MPHQVVEHACAAYLTLQREEQCVVWVGIWKPQQRLQPYKDSVHECSLEQSVLAGTARPLPDLGVNALLPALL